MAEEASLDQPICKSLVKRNTEALIADLRAVLERGSDTAVAALGVTSEQARADLDRLEQLMQPRQPEGQAELERVQAHHQGATPPKKGQSASLAYRLHVLFVDRWNLWPSLTRYRTWHGPKGETIDGTNNACERGFGASSAERHRLEDQGTLSLHAQLQADHVGCEGQPLAGLLWHLFGAWRLGPGDPLRLDRFRNEMDRCRC